MPLLGLLENQATVVETLPGDLMQLLGNIEISGVFDRPHLNSLFGTIRGFDEMKSAYIIHLFQEFFDMWVSEFSICFV